MDTGLQTPGYGLRTVSCLLRDLTAGEASGRQHQWPSIYQRQCQPLLGGNSLRMRKRSLVLQRGLPVSTDGSSPVTGLVELRAFGVCPFAHERHLKKTLLVYDLFI